MKNKITSMGNVSPVAYIAKNKQRIKQYQDTVYLKNGDIVEIEIPGVGLLKNNVIEE